MHCRYNTKRLGLEDFHKMFLIEDKAKFCELSGNFAMAAILWRRINKMDYAKICEDYLQNMVERN